VHCAEAVVPKGSDGEYWFVVVEIGKSPGKLNFLFVAYKDRLASSEISIIP